MIVISKILLGGTVALAIAGSAALMSGPDSSPVADRELPSRVAPNGALVASSRGQSSLDGDSPAAYAGYYAQTGQPGCPASACSWDAMFHLAPR